MAPDGAVNPMIAETFDHDRRRGRILLVEDNEAAGRGLARLLQAQGYEVTTVLNGEDALLALSQGRPPDVLLTDMQLPDMDGREVARQARLLEPAPRILLVTGWDLELGPDGKKTWGIDEVLVKPVDLTSLVAALGC